MLESNVCLLVFLFYSKYTNDLSLLKKTRRPRASPISRAIDVQSSMCFSHFLPSMLQRRSFSKSKPITCSTQDQTKFIDQTKASLALKCYSRVNRKPVHVAAALQVYDVDHACSVEDEQLIVVGHQLQHRIVHVDYIIINLIISKVKEWLIKMNI